MTLRAFLLTGCAPALLLLPLAASAQRTGAPQTRTASLPEPRTALTGRTLEFDFPGLLIGTAEYDEGPTGVTVFYFPGRATASVDVRGGAPGTVNTDALRLGYGPQMSAIVFAGGSWHGLAAVTGVADAIRARQSEQGDAPRIVGVAGAIVNDLGFGSGVRRFSAITPDARLADAALRAARPGRFLQGPRGAGRFVMTGSAIGDREFSGQGGAFRQVGQTKIAVFTIVNAAGLVVDRSGRVVRCRSMQWGESCRGIADVLAARADTIAARAARDSTTRPSSGSGPSENTTITVVVTNQKLEWWALERLAAQVHTSMARAIQPFATVGDGDVLFAVTTGEVDNPRLSPGELTLVASEVAWDAVLNSVPESDALTGAARISVSPEALAGYVGEYELGPGTRVSIKRDGDGLSAESAGGGQYFPVGRPVRLIPVARDEFVVDAARRDRVRFERNSGQISGLTINPGRWALEARRVVAPRR